MQQINSRYYFRKRDFLKIRNWYEATKFNYVPEDTLQKRKIDKFKEWHFQFQFASIDLAQEHVHKNLKNISSAKQIVFLTSIFQRSSGCVLAYGKQIIRQASFNLSTYSIVLKEDIAVYFYIEDVTPRDYQFCLQIQLITKEGNFIRLGIARYSLNQAKQVKKSKFLIFNHNKHQFDFDQENSKVKETRKQGQTTPYDVGVIQIEQELQEIKDISKYLPPLKIINQESKLPPAVNFNIKKKKEQMMIDPSFKITLQDLLIKINNPRELKRQILANNSFTMSHKEVVQFQIKEYLLTLDMHNGWKFMNPTKNKLQMELVIQNQVQIYVSSKQTEKLNLGYYEHEGILFVIILSCQVNFKLKQTNQSRKGEFIIGWLPLPIDLSLKDNKIDMFFVNDHPFPATLLPHLSVQSNFTANFVHPLYQKYKQKQDDRKVLMDELPLGQRANSEPNKVIKMVKSKKLGAQIVSSAQIAEREEMLDAQIQTMRNIIRSNQQQFQKNRFAKITGRHDLGQQKMNEPCHLDVEQCVGKVLKVRIQMKSLIPETQVPSIYFMPRKMNGHIYFMRQRHDFNCSIGQSQVKYHIPVSLNCSKSHFSFKINIDSVQQFQAVVNSRLVLTLYEQNNSVIYCKGTINLIDILGSPKIENVSYLKLAIWMQQGERNFGTILINSLFQIQKIKKNYRKIEQLQLQKEIKKLPMQQRLKMRIGNFKGDDQIKNKAVSILKQKKHLEFVSNIVQNELLSDGLITYQLGFDSFYLLAFTNQDKSQNNIFTFHLDCPYAQLVTDQEQYRTIVNSLNVQQQNYKFLQFFVKDKTQSYYQTTLQFNQSIGLLVKLNLNEYKKGSILKKLQLVIKRNTIQTKRLVLKCAYKEPLIWQYFQCYDIFQTNNNTQAKISLIDQIASKFKDINVLNQNIRFDYRTKEIILTIRGLSTYELLCIVTPNYSKIKKTIILTLKLYPGRQMQIIAGQKVKPHVQFESKYPTQIIRSQSKYVNIASEVRFNLSSSQILQEIYIQLLRPTINLPIVISTYDTSGQKLWSYLIKLTANLSSNVNKIELNDTQNISFTIQCENPYASKNKFALFSSSKFLKISETQILIGKYEQKGVLCKISQWNCKESSIFVFMIDHRGNVIQTTQVMITPKESIIYQRA